MEKLVYKISKKKAKALQEEYDKEKQERAQYRKALNDWFSDFIDKNESKMTIKGFKRFLNHIINKKNVKVADDAIKYMAKTYGMDMQLLIFAKPYILENFSDWAAEYYGDMLMDC